MHQKCSQLPKILYKMINYWNEADHNCCRCSGKHKKKVKAGETDTGSQHVRQTVLWLKIKVKTVLEKKSLNIKPKTLVGANPSVLNSHLLTNKSIFWGYWGDILRLFALTIFSPLLAINQLRSLKKAISSILNLHHLLRTIPFQRFCRLLSLI